MTNKAYTDITIILDRSGSMASLQKETIGGLNSFLKKQSDAELSTHSFVKIKVVQFDDQYEPGNTYNATIHPIFNEFTYQPRGMTALYDAIGKTVNAAGARFAAMNERDRPEKVLFVIITDGMENSSHEFTNAKIKEMIAHQQKKYLWDFVYMGANQDAWAVGATMGFANGKIMGRGMTGQAVMDMYQNAGDYATRTVMCSAAATATANSFTSEEVEKAIKEGAVKNTP